VKWLDEIVRDQVVQSLSVLSRSQPMYPVPLLVSWYAATDKSVAQTARLRLARLQLAVSPFLTFEIDSSNAAMVRVTHEYEFSASHRLHNAQRSPEENRRMYGKCNNPHGHGHNYVLQVTWQLPASQGDELALETYDAIVKQTVIDRLDHRYLNMEVPPFDQVNPTVENIALAIWQWLSERFAAPIQLYNVRVYETAKTWADCNGPLS
jgi:6-pyruvoyltetrahydropterin/6-carboxytetrahydropterin synthase